MRSAGELYTSQYRLQFQITYFTKFPATTAQGKAVHALALARLAPGAPARLDLTGGVAAMLGLALLLRLCHVCQGD